MLLKLKKNKKIFLIKCFVVGKSVILDIAMDWSDHAIWWPTRNIWLDKTRSV